MDWFLINHPDKIAHSDESRNMIQIHVLDQTRLGSRQCGYHAIRNYFYLAALSVALQNKDSVLINWLYNELHSVLAFRYSIVLF